MKILRTMQSRMTIQQFADKHNLVLLVRERDQSFSGTSMQFYAYFDRAEIKEGIILTGATGDGKTEEAAIDDYRKHISGKVLVIGAYTPERREIVVPILSEYIAEKEA